MGSRNDAQFMACLLKNTSRYHILMIIGVFATRINVRLGSLVLAFDTRLDGLTVYQVPYAGTDSLLGLA